MNHATMLYRPCDEPNEGVWGLKVETLVVDASEIDEHLSQGWHRHPHDADAARAAPNLLDLPAKEIEAKLKDLSDEELLQAIDDENAGKTRKGVIALLEEEAKRRT